MATVPDIAFAFGYYAKRLNAFADELETDETVKENMERRTKLKTLCETRMFSREMTCILSRQQIRLSFIP